ncbi:nitrogen fixation protein NifX [Nodosilinea sp. LEGE 07088]|uniref:nitrogen fixation protein NifX n=1 Tax=Nodosilinea sp. LEGE 07088 TaxID=2777968 RepID=UPI00187EC500|nr:nitrogen fixation protein NifX [Nodosilinea sp. LEGE 07088]MBE9138691.1 nitrogen fixation protein NifX [Nodosilinea sp. LEGE 07088]
MKVAFTTKDSEYINAHFGWAKRIDVYDVDTAGYRFLETLEFGGDLKEDGNEDKLEPKVKALEDCTIVYVLAIGGSAAARLIRKNVTPIKAQTEADEIQDVLTRLVQTLNGSPPPWLRKALQKSQPPQVDDSFDDELETIEEELLV